MNIIYRLCAIQKYSKEQKSYISITDKINTKLNLHYAHICILLLEKFIIKKSHLNLKKYNSFAS